MSRPLPPHTKRLTPGCQKLHYEDLARLAAKERELLAARQRIDELQHDLSLAESQAQEDHERLIGKLVALADARTADKIRGGPPRRRVRRVGGGDL